MAHLHLRRKSSGFGPEAPRLCSAGRDESRRRQRRREPPQVPSADRQEVRHSRRLQLQGEGPERGRTLPRRRHRRLGPRVKSHSVPVPGVSS